ncbi:MAG: TolC family protein [Planctomycetes bacterium]|nr:TolC family protein [Planctomycetota bacterium]
MAADPVLLALALLGQLAAVPERSDALHDRLTLEDCTGVALERNRDVRTARLEMERIAADAGIERARFLPRVDAVGGMDRTFTGSSSAQALDKEGALRWTQRLLELGREAASSVNLRAARRKAFFDYQDRVADALSGVREGFFLLINRQEQIRQRRDNLRNFEENLTRQRERFERGLVIKADVLTAELSVREEELRINSLERVHFRQRMDLLDLLGLEVGRTAEFVGSLEPEFPFGQGEAVAVALERAGSVALAEEAVRERRRVLREVGTRWWPDLSFNARADSREDAVRLDLLGAQRTWGLDLTAEHFFERPQARFQTFRNAEDEVNWFVGMDLVLPLFDGLSRDHERRRERAALRQAEVALQEAVADVELGMRKAYQDYLEAQEELRIQMKTLDIARERLSITLELKQYGRASDNEVETFRQRLFIEQDALFRQQDNLIRTMERLRRLMRKFD